MKKIVRNGVITVATALMVVAGAGSAMANSSVSISYQGITRASASFNSTGEHLRVTDSYADGWGARSYYSSSAGSGVVTNENGAGTTVDSNLSIPNGQSVSYNICSKNGSVNLACSGYVGDTA